MRLSFGYGPSIESIPIQRMGTRDQNGLTPALRILVVPIASEPVYHAELRSNHTQLAKGVDKIGISR